jgi:hypothetical protein
VLTTVKAQHDLRRHEGVTFLGNAQTKVAGIGVWKTCRGPIRGLRFNPWKG